MVNILFVCQENACRSQMAEAFARYYGKGVVNAASAGSRSRGYVDTGAKSVMAECGISLDDHESKGLEALPVQQWDVVIGMGCGNACPQVDAVEHLEWNIPDPVGEPPARYRAVRDLIDTHVKALVHRWRSGS